MIAKDLRLVKEAVLKLISIDHENDWLLAQSLSFMIIVTYGKCFADAEGRGRKLDKKSALKGFSMEEIEIHKQWILLRNRYVAHAGVSRFETNQVIVTRIVDKKGNYVYMCHDSAIYMSSLIPNLAVAEVYLSKLLSFVENKIDKAYAALKKFVVENLTDDDFETNCFFPELEKLVRIQT